MAKRKSKMNAVKVTTEEGTFGSKHEYARWCILKEQLAAGKIRDLQKQVRFGLLPVQRAPYWIGKNGAVHQGRVIERKVDYIADFTYFKINDDGTETYIVEDAKGFRKKEYILKRKMMLFFHGIEILET